MNYQIILSSGELYTLAGLLRFSCLYGIENDTMDRWQSDLQKHIRQMVKQLEKRKLVFFELYGKLIIEEDLKNIMELMAKPDRIAIVSRSIRNGQTATVYVCEQDGLAISVSRIDEDNYKIVMYHSDEIVKLICGNFISDMNEPLHEKILFEDVKYMQSQIASFQADIAKEHLSKCIADQKNLNFVYRVLEKNIGFTEARFLKRKDGFYETGINLLAVFDGDKSVSLAIDEHEVLSIDSLDKVTVDKEITEFFIK